MRRLLHLRLLVDLLSRAGQRFGGILRAVLCVGPGLFPVAALGECLLDDRVEGGAPGPAGLGAGHLG